MSDLITDTNVLKDLTKDFLNASQPSENVQAFHVAAADTREIAFSALANNTQETLGTTADVQGVEVKNTFNPSLG